MSNELQVESLRLKYANKFVIFTLKSNDTGLLDISVSSPSSGLEKDSFNRITREISKLVYSGNRDRKYIRGVLNRMLRVDNQVLKFMLRVVNEKLPLEG